MKFPRANRRVTAGKHPLTKAFPGLDEDAAFVELFGDGARREVLEKCYIEAVAEDMYMYIDDSDGHIVAGLGDRQSCRARDPYLAVTPARSPIRPRRAGPPAPARAVPPL